MRIIIRKIGEILMDKEIKNEDELEFAVFCIESIASKLGKNAEDVFKDLTEKSDILYSSNFAL